MFKDISTVAGKAAEEMQRYPPLCLSAAVLHSDEPQASPCEKAVCGGRRMRWHLPAAGRLWRRQMLQRPLLLTYFITAVRVGCCVLRCC